MQYDLLKFRILILLASKLSKLPTIFISLILLFTLDLVSQLSKFLNLHPFIILLLHFMFSLHALIQVIQLAINSFIDL